jgi:hypothetical protein
MCQCIQCGPVMCLHPPTARLTKHIKENEHVWLVANQESPKQPPLPPTRTFLCDFP